MIWPNGDETAGVPPPPRRVVRLAADHHRHRAAVLRPRALVAAERERPFLAVADRRDPRRVDAPGGQIVLGGVRAAVAQRQIVFAGAALVGMAFDDDAVARILVEPLRLLAQRLLGVGVPPASAVFAMRDSSLGETMNCPRLWGIGGISSPSEENDDLVDAV